MEIDPAIQKVEFKFTALSEDEGRVLDFLAGRPQQQRQVYFYDTEDLALKHEKIFLRGRVTDGAGESTAKLRPVERDVAIAAHEDNDKVRIELDVVGTEAAWSAKLDRDPIDPAAIETGDMDALFSGKQRKLIDDRDLDGLKVLGPIEAHVWEIEDLPGFPYKLAAEEWSIPGEHFIELSIKVKPGEADTARLVFRAFLTGLVRDIDGDRSRKTERMLQRLAG
jgi:hypothetical protein